MNILVRLPNWLGDVVMSTAFIQELQAIQPQATIDVIIKKELAGLTQYFPAISHTYAFSKAEYPGIRGTYRFGREIAAAKKYDLFFSLPDSLSSAVIGYAANAQKRIGYQKELRSLFLTHAYKKPKNLHRVDEYVYLLEQFLGIDIKNVRVRLEPKSAFESKPSTTSAKSIVVNFNSEAQSRRVPLEKAISIVSQVRPVFQGDIIFIGSGKEKAFVDQIIEGLATKEGIVNLAGQTSLVQLVEVIHSADLMISSDSGPAHLANSVGTKLLVLFGAGNENNTGPYNKPGAHVMRLPGLPCAPCVSNTCKFGVPKCLTGLDNTILVNTALQLLES